jgi:hypothetical protein
MKYYYIDKNLLRNTKSYIDNHYSNPGFNIPFYNILLSKIYSNVDENFVRTHVNFINIICDWCENEAIYDKLSKYNDFYYKFKNLTR